MHNYIFKCFKHNIFKIPKIFFLMIRQFLSKFNFANILLRFTEIIIVFPKYYFEINCANIYQYLYKINKSTLTFLHASI